MQRQIKSGETIEFYGKIPISLQPIDLIRRLEQLHHIEIMRIEAAKAAAIQPMDIEREFVCRGNYTDLS